MGQIIKQPDGLYAVWSSVIDDFTLLDATPEEIIQQRIEDASQEIREGILNTIKELDAGGKPSFQFTMSWDECLLTIKERHGKTSWTWEAIGIDPKTIRRPRRRREDK